MALLAIETATNTCGAAVAVDGTVVAEAHMHRPRTHARHLTPLIEDVLARAEVNRDELAAVAVSKGPGSYTGLRIGVSTAKGWAEATGAALIGIPTLEAMAVTVTPYASDGDVVCAALDARRDEVYAGAYRIRRTEDQRDAQLPESLPARLTIQAAASAMSVDALPGWIGIDGMAGGATREDSTGQNMQRGARLWLLGNGAAKSESALRTTGCTIRMVPDVAGRPSAAWVARCAVHALRTGKASEPETFEPMYLKAFHAG